ncbi:multiple coagulation factor deficiency protein 2 homolog isoform X1 [Tubulanus polymorphus]|uniref:multiple coagulation factor deficiency protein 2 homolog isoform X1 n=1 Tax=Tubulanus polymorphus TaxID=672921 RepID=UPI003DA5DFBE
MAYSSLYIQVLSLLFVLLIVVVKCHGPHGHGDAGQGIQNPMDTAHVHDKEHIKDHLDGVVKKDPAEMTNEELEFHYFKLHDYDNDNKLDGLEIVKAITHYNADRSSSSENQDTKSYTDNELSELVDSVLQEEDKNDDGFIDYPEFKAAQKKGQEVSSEKIPEEQAAAAATP